MSRRFVRGQLCDNRIGKESIDIRTIRCLSFDAH